MLMVILTTFLLFYSASVQGSGNDTLPRSDTIEMRVIDKWVAEDKFWHFGMSFALVGSSYHLFKCRLQREENRATLFSLGGTFSLGVLKELWDMKKPKGYFSYRDLIYNLLGIGVGYLVFIYD